MTGPEPTPPTRDLIDERWQVSPRRPDGGRGRAGAHLGPIRLTPTRVMLAIAMVGSLLYIVFALAIVREKTQIPLLSSGAGVLGVVFAALAVSGGYATYRAGDDGSAARALGMAVLGGIAGVIAAGCFAAALILALAWSQG
jgi:hypothetical protein